jgi:hypothetical protein
LRKLTKKFSKPFIIRINSGKTRQNFTEEDGVRNISTDLTSKSGLTNWRKRRRSILKLRWWWIERSIWRFIRKSRKGEINAHERTLSDGR